MSEDDDSAGRDEATKAGYTLLLGGGVAEAMATAEVTLTTVRRAAERAFATIRQLQTAGAAAAAVPAPVRPAVVAATPLDVPPTGERLLPKERFSPQVMPRPAGAVQAAAFAPVSVPATSVATFAPVPAPGSRSVAAGVPTVLLGGGMTPHSVPPPPLTAQPEVEPIPLASFAPAAPPDSKTATVAAIAGSGQCADAPTARRDSGGRAPAAGESMAPTSAPAANGEPLRSYAPPIAQAAPGGPTGGDVFLDGARVGTWLADHLAREAGRPQTGSTGFDPRLTPAWPGTLQGG